MGMALIRDENPGSERKRPASDDSRGQILCEEGLPLPHPCVLAMSDRNRTAVVVSCIRGT